MNARRSLRGPHPSILLAACLLLACSGGGGPPERIVLIVVDTLRRDALSCYGGPRATPNIDALAARGQQFRNVHASFHQTSMSMGSLFTGRTPSIEFAKGRSLFWNSLTWCGMNRFASADDEHCIPPSVPTLAAHLREAGYWTIGLASNQFLYEPSGFGRGFDDWVEVGAKPPEEGELAFLRIPPEVESRKGKYVNRAVVEALERRESDRFFLYVHYMDVHDYLGARPLTKEGWEVPMGDYYANAVGELDLAVGRLLDDLEEEGLLEDAVVILTADHGERLGEPHAVRGTLGHVGNPTFLEHLRIPLIVVPPTEEDSERFLRSQDLFHMILGIVGVETEGTQELRSGELFVSETSYRTYLDGRFKSSFAREDGEHLLFDMDVDPGERRDVADRHPDVVTAHRARIEELSSELSARRAVIEKLTTEDRERLRALGYLDDDDVR